MVITMSSRSVRWTLVIPALLAALAAYPAAAAAQDSRSADKLDGVLRGRARQLVGRSRVIVQFTGTPDVRAITGRRGTVGRRLAAHRAQVAELNNLSLLDLASDPRVARVVLDRETFATVERTSAAIGAALAREQFDVSGAGVGIAVIDSGVTTWHDDLYVGTGRAAANRVAGFKDFTTGVSSSRPSDPYGHGTHVAGIIAGSGYDSHGRRSGVAPGAHIVGLKVLDAAGHGYVSDVIEALDYAVATKDVYRIKVINLSVGAAVTESFWTDPLTIAARRAVDAGIVVVAAAGNLGSNSAGQTQFGGITAPGNAPWVLTVGASNHGGTARRADDTIGTFSSRGPTWGDFTAKPDLIAPGVGIESLSDPLSTLYSEQSRYLLNGTRPTWYKPYLSMSGTSMAAPVVAGTVALMLEANPRLTPNAIKAILQYTAQERPGESPLAQGAGLLNARGALRMARFFASPRDGFGTPSDSIEKEKVAWSQQLIWGNYRVTGGVPLPGSNAWTLGETWGQLKTASGTPVIWGAKDAKKLAWTTPRGSSSTSSGDNIVWSTGGSDNIVWSTGGSDNIVWSTGGSDNIVWSTGGSGENIVWSTGGGDNIVWSTAIVQNLVWGLDCGGPNCQRVVWGAAGVEGTWGSSQAGDNIVWSTGGGDENIVWSTGGGDNIVWSTGGGDENIVWSTGGGDNIVWSTAAAGQVLWSAAPVVNPAWQHARMK